VWIESVMEFVLGFYDKVVDKRDDKVVDKRDV
jgi:hypothetical protein